MAKKHKKQKKQGKWLYWGLVLMLFIVAAVVVYLVWDSYFRDKTNDGEQDNTQVEAVIEKSDEAPVNDEIMEKPKIVQYDGEDPNELEELSGAVTYAGMAGDNLMIRVNIDQYLEGGKCTLNIVRGGTVIYNNVVGIIGNVATATCEGFDVPVNELGVGDVEIEIKLSADGKSGVIHGEASI